MRLLVTGSRRWADRTTLYTALDDVYRTLLPGETLTVVHGDASGADRIAHQWCEMMHDRAGDPDPDVVEEPHPADWVAPCRTSCYPNHRIPRPGGSSICRAAGNYRNQAMVDLGADRCVAFLQPGAWNKGTKDCVRRARKAGIFVVEYPRPDDRLPCGCTPADRAEQVRRLDKAMRERGDL